MDIEVRNLFLLELFLHSKSNTSHSIKQEYKPIAFKTLREKREMISVNNTERDFVTPTWSPTGGVGKW